MGGIQCFLPPRDSEEGKKLAKYYQVCKVDELDRLAKEYGYANRCAFQTAIFSRWAIRRQRQKRQVQIEPPIPILNLPEVKLRLYQPVAPGKGDPETQVVLLGDHHAGEITPTYNPEIFKKRLDQLFQSLLRVTYLHRNMYPVKDLVIVLGGDMVQGEDPRKGSTIEQIDRGVQAQIFDIALPELLNFVLSAKQEFETIKIYGIRGNHGRYSRFAPATSNWDIMLYKSLAGLVKRYSIDCIVSNEFCQLIDIQGFRFFAFHGDQVRTSHGIPYFALDRKIKSWFITYRPGFNYALCFHWHKDDFWRISAQTKLFINGSLVSDDPFALEVIGTSAVPTQWTFGVHRRFGVTWAYSVYPDFDFLPQKY